jgi:hypothetical protein
VPSTPADGLYKTVARGFVAAARILGGQQFAPSELDLPSTPDQTE